MMAALQKLWSQIPGPVQHTCSCATFWALLLGVIGIWFLLPTRLRYGKALGSVLVAIAGGLFAYDLPLLGNLKDHGLDQAVFWLLTAITLGAAVATITSQAPIYSAIWFALSLLGTAGLFLFQGAQFLAGATVVVYAGAIVVTFLFVIMLAQPEGHSAYDRLTWGGLPKILGVASAGLLVGILTFMLGKTKHEIAQPAAMTAAAPGDGARTAVSGIRSDKHVANLGRHLFGEHLLSIEIAGTLLLVALVGAVAIAIAGKPRLAQRIEEALR
jgi:NADH-quinone oxidoreductase subunit J